jgi:hypothetical protein
MGITVASRMLPLGPFMTAKCVRSVASLPIRIRTRSRYVKEDCNSCVGAATNYNWFIWIPTSSGTICTDTLTVEVWLSKWYIHAYRDMMYIYICIYVYYVMIQCIWIPWKSMHSNPYCFAADIWRIVLFPVWGLVCKYAPYTYLHTVNLHIHGRIAHHCKALINGPHSHLPKIITGSTGTWLEL